ncbi:MAG: hypothetical protein HC835_14395 [Oscillatoriales cyanobacterium RM2_1_1]|nr:hypothetical protein [Oscillatoriales cyanobacterium SM2_3_0]NJO46710.1 hypothetical protein [Oscillatoriales cyanobacterium RM2_1_1]
MINGRSLTLLLLVVFPGAAVVGLSAYWGFVLDFPALVVANQRFESLVQQGAGQQDLFIAAHREQTHRMNVGFDGTWLVLGMLIMGVGIHGIAQTKD